MYNDFMRAKIVKGIKNIFKKLLARKKTLCIFALGFRITVIQNEIDT
jgi:ribosomal protein L7Ae-like RNA K-turn-binding protein